MLRQFCSHFYLLNLLTYCTTYARLVQLAGWARSTVCLSVCLCVNQGDTNHNRRTRRFLILHGDSDICPDNPPDISHSPSNSRDIFPHKHSFRQFRYGTTSADMLLSVLHFKSSFSCHNWWKYFPCLHQSLVWMYRIQICEIRMWLDICRCVQPDISASQFASFQLSVTELSGL